jgi:hypothetical protein
MNLTDMQDNIDPIHAKCRELQAWIREEFAKASNSIQTWEPRPVPPTFR